MPLPLAAIGLGALALKAAGSVFGGINASQAMKNYKRNVQGQMAENEDIYQRDYNADATQKADAVRALTLTEDYIRKSNKAATGTNAVMGGNEANVAAQREANSMATAEAAARIAASGEAQKESAKRDYLNRKQNLQDQLNNIEVGKAQNISQAVQGVSSAAGDALMSLGSGGDIWSNGGYTRITPGQIASAQGTANDWITKEAGTNGLDALAKKYKW